METFITKDNIRSDYALSYNQVKERDSLLNRVYNRRQKNVLNNSSQNMF